MRPPPQPGSPVLRSLFAFREPPVERVVQIYFAGTRFIVAATHRNKAGVYYEQPGPAVIDVRQPADLGIAPNPGTSSNTVRLTGRDGEPPQKYGQHTPCGASATDATALQTVR